MRRPPAGLLVAALLLAGACAGDDGGDPSDPEDPAGATSAPGDATTDPREVAADPSAGCGREAVARSETEETVRSGGTDRSYTRYVPRAHDGEVPVPVVVDFHGYSEGGPIHVLHTALGPFGDEEGFVTVTPDSGYPVPRWATDLEADDVALFGDLLDQVESDLCVDRNRVFVTGLSNGAFMTSSLACAYSDRIAAVAPVAGIRDPEGCDLTRPVPVVAFHGTEDTYVSFDGGLGSSVADLPSPDGSGTLGEGEEGEAPAGADDPEELSVPEVTAAWAERNGCDPDADEEAVADDVVLLAFTCPPGSTTRLYRVEGGGHTWPGSEFSAGIEDIVGTTTFSISANEVMWDFFEAHPLPG